MEALSAERCTAVFTHYRREEEATLKRGKLDEELHRLSDIVGAQVINQVGRIPGVGSTFQVGSEYGMRVWLNPDKMQGYGLSATQVQNAISAQNVQFAAGSLKEVERWVVSADLGV